MVDYVLMESLSQELFPYSDLVLSYCSGQVRVQSARDSRNLSAPHSCTSGSRLKALGQKAAGQRCLRLDRKGLGTFFIVSKKTLGREAVSVFFAPGERCRPHGEWHSGKPRTWKVKSQTGSSADSDGGRSRKRRLASYCLIRL
jgi:hypothetical protein